MTGSLARVVAGKQERARRAAHEPALAVTIVALGVFLTSRTGQLKLDPGRNIYLTLVMVGCLYLGFVASGAPGTATALGFRTAPRQGWFFWLWVCAVVGVVQLLDPGLRGLLLRELADDRVEGVAVL